MTDYQKIQNHCMAVSIITEQLIDDFLLPYISEREGLEKKFGSKLLKHKTLVQKMPRGWVEWTASQYMAHCIFKKGGFAAKYSKTRTVRQRSGAECELLDTYMERPWRFSFCAVREQVAPGFFEMRDIFSGDVFLLYSTGVENVLEESPQTQSFLLLISDNGMCWQTYGTIAHFKGFQPFDFFFFAKRINPNIDFPSDAQAVVEKDPVPFMLLFGSGEFPLTIARGDVVAHCYSEFYLDDFESEPYLEDFIIDEKTHVQRLQLKGFEEFPHFATGYFHKKKKRLVLTAMTRKGYEALTDALNKPGYDFPNEPETMATASMLASAKFILKRDFDPDPYGKIFHKKSTPEETAMLKKVNRFTSLFMDAYNKGERNPDVKTMADKAGLDMENAQMLVRQMLDKFNDQSWQQ